MIAIRFLRTAGFRPPAISVALIVGFLASTDGAIGQAYTYDEPVCGAMYREEAAKPKELRVIWETTAGQKCVEQSRFPLACQHFRSAIIAHAQVPSWSGEAFDLKTYLNTLMKTNGCQ